ncbi:MAG: hypothetical protein AB8B94_17090 [Hyphomicrobiales bacterium]
MNVQSSQKSHGYVYESDLPPESNMAHLNRANDLPSEKAVALQDQTTRICLPPPTMLRSRMVGENHVLRDQLKALASKQMSELEQFASLNVPTNATKGNCDTQFEKLGVWKYDIYDEYFEVIRTSENPADELAAAFIISLIEVGQEAKRGHNLDPLALNAFLRAVKVQAKVLLQEAYYG